MASILGNGPVGFTTPKGAHAIIPLGDISFDAIGGIVIDNKWKPPSGVLADDAAEWASYLLDQGELAVDAAPVAAPTPPGPAFLVEAVHPGDASHSAIKLTIANPHKTAVNPPGATSYTLDVLVENTYIGLTLKTIADVIGTSVDGGSQPGLVHLGASPALPLTQMPDNDQTQNIAGTPPVHATFVGNAKDAFSLEAPGDGGIGGGNVTFTALVSGVAGDSFDLKVTWSKSNIGTTASHAAAFAYVIKIIKPPGSDFGAPPSGNHVYLLSGGGDPDSTPVAATPATATIPSV